MKTQLVKKYLRENPDVAFNIARDLNNWDGSCDWVDTWDPDELIELQCQDVETAKELIRAICYGEASINAEYWRYNAYGNIENVSYSELLEEAVDDIDTIVDELENNYLHVYIEDDELESLIEEDDEMTIKFTNIVYDYDENDEDEKEAISKEPTELEITIYEYDDDEETYADLISNETGWCVKSFDYEVIHRDSEE